MGKCGIIFVTLCHQWNTKKEEYNDGKFGKICSEMLWKETVGRDVFPRNQRTSGGQQTQAMDTIVCAPDAGAVCRRLPPQHQVLHCPWGAAHYLSPGAAGRVLNQPFNAPEPPFQTSRESFSNIAIFETNVAAIVFDCRDVCFNPHS